MWENSEKSLLERALHPKKLVAAAAFKVKFQCPNFSTEMMSKEKITSSNVFNICTNLAEKFETY